VGKSGVLEHKGATLKRVGLMIEEKLLLSQEGVKLWTSKLAGTFTGSIRTKARKKFGGKGAWAYLGTAQIF